MRSRKALPKTPRTVRWAHRATALLSLCVFSAMCVVVAAQSPRPQKPPAKPSAKPSTPAPKPSAPAPKSAAPAAKPAPPPPPDLVVKTEYASGDKTTLTTISAKGQRQRIDYGTEMSVIAACDAGQLIQIANQGERYLVAPLNAPPVEPSGKPPKKGGTITVARTVTMLEERQEMFGQQARRAKIVVTKTPSADACDKHSEKIETDGWFIAQPPSVACTVPTRTPAFAVTNGCRDEITYTGADETAGYPMSYTAVTTGDDPPSPPGDAGASARPGGKTITTTMAVKAFDRQTLPDSLFTQPDGYREVKTLADLTATVKKSGNTRVGVVPLTTKLKDQFSLQDLSDALVVSLNDANVDAVPLEATSAASAIEEARAKKVDYLLVTEVTDLRKPQRGLVGRVTGARDFGAKVDYLLVSPGAVSPALSGSERSGTSTVQMAVKTAQTAYRFATPMGLLGQRFNFMQTYMAMAGGPSGNASGVPTSDPVINTLFQVLNTSTGTNQPQEMADSADAAIATALEKEVAAVAAKLQR